MAIAGNKGEWSEAYVLLRLLADGKLFAADKHLSRLENMFFPIIRIIREETVGTKHEYILSESNAEIEIFVNGTKIMRMPATKFDEEAKRLFAKITAHGSGKGSLTIPQTEAFIRSVHITRLKAPSFSKSDINIQIHDYNTGFENIVGFSIKSELGSPPTLLNAGRTTNFIYRVEGLDGRNLGLINAISTKNKIRDRIRKINESGGQLVFDRMENGIFESNLFMIDSQMQQIVSEVLKGYYSENIVSSAELVDYVSRIDPLICNPVFYKHKFKELLCAIALGMKPATPWNGMDEATGGYIVVRGNGDVLAYHIYNRDAFREYLLENTKLDSASSGRHGYGVLYEQDGGIFIKLNLQIRFQ